MGLTAAIGTLAWVATSMGGCRRGNAARAAGKHLAVELKARCAQTGPQDKPLLVEWPGIQRGSMEAQFKRGDGRLVVVRYHGCEMDVLRTCSVRGKYKWTPFEPKSDRVTIRDLDEVYAKVPLGAAELVSAVERYGALQLDMTLLGEYDSRQIEFSRDHLEGNCDEATHVVTAATVGAFAIHSLAGAKIGASAKFGRAGAGGQSRSDQGYISRDGDLRACTGQSRTGPPDHCAALVRVEVVGLQSQSDYDDKHIKTTCPEGMVLVEGGRYHDDRGFYHNVQSFCLDRTEVTVGAYKTCVKEHTCSAASATAADPNLPPAAVEQLSRACNRGRHRKHPVNCINHDQAASYCRAAGYRLPTFDEWTWAARGGLQNRTYPWGEDTPSRHHLNACGKECVRAYKTALDLGEPLFDRRDGARTTRKVGHYDDGTGRWELVDLAGNVAEWIDTRETIDDVTGNWARGGSFLTTDRTEIQATGGVLLDPAVRRPDLGFRCAADPV